MQNRPMQKQIDNTATLNLGHAVAFSAAGAVAELAINGLEGGPKAALCRAGGAALFNASFLLFSHAASSLLDTAKSKQVASKSVQTPRS